MGPGNLNTPGLTALMLLAACSMAPYTPRALDSEASVTEFLARSVQVDELKQFAQANGYAHSWPPQQWDVEALTLVAWYFHPDIRIARAHAALAHAELGSAVQPGPLSARFTPEYHSATPAETNGPWTLGLQLEIPLVSQGKQAAQAERSAFLADAADLDVANAAWIARARVRNHFLELRANREVLALLDLLIAARQEMLGLVERRVQAGMLSGRELTAERALQSQLAQSRNTELARQQQATASLAAALGLPNEAVEGMALAFEEETPGPATLDAGALRRMALRNRLDVHRKLLEFGAADAEVKAAVAAQNPDITLGPGYAWDQGDNIWSLAVGLSLPPAGKTRALIREAQARRELAAEQFWALQFQVVALATSAGAQYLLASERVNAAEQQLRIQQEQESRTLRQFASGAADRMQRVAARIDTLAAESARQAALVARRQSLAQLEDALQRPLFGISPDRFARLPNPANASRRVASKALVQPAAS